MAKCIYQEGEKVGSCYFIMEAEPKVRENRSPERYAMFLCVCGNTFKSKISHVKDGKTTSCKCLQRKYTSLRRLTHGESYSTKRTVEYACWSSMKRRCYNPNVNGYDRYGGRGILVSEEWKDSFETFLADMGKKPSANHSIERINNDGNYCKGNCIWATKRQQLVNRHNMKDYSYNGVSKKICEWAEEYGIPRKALWKRLVVLNWDIERALTTQPTDNINYQWDLKSKNDISL
jgi:hypothetical protein